MKQLRRETPSSPQELMLLQVETAGDKEPTDLDQHWSKGSFSFASWGFWCNFGNELKQNFEWKLILMHIINPRCTGAVRQQDVDTWATCPALTHSALSLWSVFSPMCATAFVCYTLSVWLCNAAEQGQPCRAAENKEGSGPWWDPVSILKLH